MSFTQMIKLKISIKTSVKKDLYHATKLFICEGNRVIVWATQYFLGIFLKINSKVLYLLLFSGSKNKILCFKGLIFKLGTKYIS